MLRTVVSEAIAELRETPIPASWVGLLAGYPYSTLGRLGSTQELLYFVVRKTFPAVAVETGVFRGLSSAFILAAMEDNRKGKLYSVDLPNAAYRVPETGAVDRSRLGSKEETGYVIPEQLRHLWSLRLGDTRKVLPSLLNEVGPIDFFYHDSEHTEETMAWEYKLALSHLRPGGVLASDDVGWNRAFSSFVESVPLTWHGVAANRLGLCVLPPPTVAEGG